MSGFDIQKFVDDPFGDDDPSAREGWTFIATSSMEGCSNPAVAVTGTDGLAHFENIVETNADGDRCVYSVTEAQQAGYTTDDMLPFDVDPAPAGTNVATDAEHTITNKADTVSTYGDIVITKSVYDSAGTELTAAEDRSGWIMHATNDPVVAGCTTSATAVTDSNGVAWFTGLVKTTADGDDCTYVITEAPEVGYTVAGSPTAAITPVDPLTAPARAATPDITNTEKIAYGSVTANKDLYDEYGNQVQLGDPRLEGWTFVAIAETSGCTTTAIQTTDDQGEVEFTDLIATNSDGVTCTYTIDEVRGPGYTVTGAPYTGVTPGNPDPTDAGTITNTLTAKATTGDVHVQKTVNLQDGTTWDDNANGTPAAGWVFTLTGTAPCTTGPVYAITDETGGATFAGVINVPAGSQTACTYDITEITQPGFAVSTNPVAAVAIDGTAEFTNDERERIGEIQVQKTVIDELGTIITSGDAVAGWTFTATSTGDGCTETAIATSGADGLATFTNLVSINPDGNPCGYTVTEVEHPGWTTTWTEATTGVLPDATTPPLLRVENKADAATTPGQITISKTVQPTGAAAITPGTSNPLLAGWVFSVQAADGQPADCTQGPVYGITTDTGQTTVTGLVDQSATTGRPTCVYTVTEISRPGYTATPASQDVAAGGNAAFTNTEVRTFTTLDVTKETFGPDGQPDNTALAGWSFVAASAQDGCTVTAVATTGTSGQATFDNLVDIAPSGVECTYLVTEMGQSGWTQISASPGPVNPPAAVSFANQADPVSTFGFASVQKDARAADGSALPDRLAGWAMTAVSAQPGCTPSSVALTDATGLAVFSGLVDVTAAGTQCLYTITEIPAAGYQVSGSPVLSVDPTTTLGAPAAIITNTEIQTLGTLSVAKTVLDPFGQPVADASGWTFLATSAMSGCTTAAAGVTAADGSLTLGPLVDISSAGEQCTYTLIEVGTAGFVTTDVPITGTLTGLAQPVQVTNRADSVSVDGVITVQKMVLDPDGVEMPTALGDWVFVANGEIAGCTPAAFGMTDSTGLATLDVVETLANGTACTYTISEIGADGYLTDITPSTDVTAGATVAATNQEIAVPVASVNIVKTGADDGVPLGGWVFVATTNVSGCPSNRTAVTNAQGLAEFFELPTESPDGVACEYTIVEIGQAGFETDSPASGSYTLIPTDGETLEFVNSTIDDGTGVAGNIDLGCGFAVVGSNVVEPGDQVSFYAYGYQPGTVLVIEANGVTLGTFTVPASGVVTGLVTIPDLAPGAYQLTATGTGTDGGARVMSCPYISIPASTPTTASGTTTGGTTTGGGEVGATTGAGEVGAATGGATATTQPNTGVGAGSVTTLPPTGLPSGVAGAGTATTIPSGVAGNGSTIDPAVAAAIDAANAAITAAQTRGTAGDSDGDGVLDTIETKLGFDPNDPNSKPAADLDTDGDGFPDVVEAMLGYDWKDPNDPLNRGRFGGGASTSRSADVRGERLDNNDGSSLPQRVARTGADHLPFLLALGGGMIVLGTLINSRARRRANR